MFFQYLLKDQMPATLEATAPIDHKLREVQDTFIRRWGEMGATWGLNRTQAEIFGLLFAAGQPLCTDDVMERLNISRGNASMSLRALCDWGIIRRLHKRGERREYFESLDDVWEMFQIIATERKRREMDPVLQTIRQCQKMLQVRMPPELRLIAMVRIKKGHLRQQNLRILHIRLIENRACCGITEERDQRHFQPVLNFDSLLAHLREFRASLAEVLLLEFFAHAD